MPPALHDPAEVKTKKLKLKGLKFKRITGPATEKSKAWQRATIAARNAQPPYEDLKLQSTEIDLHRPGMEISSSASTNTPALHDPIEVKIKKTKLKGLKFKRITGPATEESKAWQRAMIAGRHAKPPYDELKLQSTTGSDDEDIVPDDTRPGAFANFLVKMDLQVRSMELANARKGDARTREFRGDANMIKNKPVKKRKLNE